MDLNDYSCSPFPHFPHSLKHLNDPPVQRARLSVPVCIRASYLYLLLSIQSLPKEEFLADAGSLFLIRFHRSDSSEEFAGITSRRSVIFCVCFLNDLSLNSDFFLASLAADINFRFYHTSKKVQIQISKKLSLLLEAVFPFMRKTVVSLTP